MDSNAKFWDRIAVRYSQNPIADEAAYQKKLAITREYLTPKSRVLEFGCGTGSTAVLHAPYVKHITAIDFADRMVEICRERAAQAGVDNITFERASIEEFEAPDAEFDVVLGLNILHLVADRDAAIAKVHRMLKPGGVFISSTACLGDSWMMIVGLVAPLGQLLGKLPLVKSFSEKRLIREFERGGFAVEQRWRPKKGQTVFIVARKTS